MRKQLNCGFLALSHRFDKWHWLNKLVSIIYVYQEGTIGSLLTLQFVSYLTRNKYTPLEPSGLNPKQTPKHWSVSYPNGPEAGREAGWGSEFVPLKKRQVGSFTLLHKISRPHVVLEYAHFWNNSIAMKALPSDTPIINICTIQWNNQQSARNTSYVLQLCCALVRDLT